MTQANPPSTPISTSKSAALSRAIDLVSKGYTRYTSGRIPERKLVRLLQKFHEKYGVACSPAQRLTRKQRGLANAALVVFLPPAPVADATTEAEDGLATCQSADEHPDRLAPGRSDGQMVEWLLLVSPGGGAVETEETLRAVIASSRLIWLGYELVRQPKRGRSSWTWRRTRTEMADWYAVLGEQLASRQMSAVAKTLALISSQPGFSGVRQQSWELLQFARSRGYTGEEPHLFFLQKLGQGKRLALSPAPEQSRTWRRS